VPCTRTVDHPVGGRGSDCSEFTTSGTHPTCGRQQDSAEPSRRAVRRALRHDPRSWEKEHAPREERQQGIDCVKLRKALGRWN
jgi:hypothetical protein